MQLQADNQPQSFNQEPTIDFFFNDLFNIKATIPKNQAVFSATTKCQTCGSTMEYKSGENQIPTIICTGYDIELQKEYQQLVDATRQFNFDIDIYINSIKADTKLRGNNKKNKLEYVKALVNKMPIEKIPIPFSNNSKLKLIPGRKVGCSNKAEFLPMSPSQPTKTPPNFKFTKSSQIVDLKSKPFPNDLYLPKGVVNNFRQTVQADFGVGSYTNTAYFSKDLPKEITIVGFNKLSNAKASQLKSLRAKQQRLPFTIKKSTIQGAGRGMFTSAKLPPSTMVMLYIGTHQSVFQHWPPSNSVYDLGFIDVYDEKTQARRLIPLVMEPILKLNSARYINTHMNRQLNNCRIERIVLDDVPYLLITTIRQIQADQQLFYSYGEDFGFSQEYEKHDGKGGQFSDCMTNPKTKDPQVANKIRKWKNMLRSEMEEESESMQMQEQPQQKLLDEAINDDNLDMDAEDLEQKPLDEAINDDNIDMNAEDVGIQQEIQAPLKVACYKDRYHTTSDERKNITKQVLDNSNGTNKFLAKLYRTYSRIYYNYLVHIYPRMRESQVVSKICKTWDWMNIDEKWDKHRIYLYDGSYSSDDESSICLSVGNSLRQTKKTQEPKVAPRTHNVRPFIADQIPNLDQDSDFERNKPKFFEQPSSDSEKESFTPPPKKIKKQHNPEFNNDLHFSRSKFIEVCQLRSQKHLKEQDIKPIQDVHTFDLSTRFFQQEMVAGNGQRGGLILKRVCILCKDEINQDKAITHLNKQHTQEFLAGQIYINHVRNKKFYTYVFCAEENERYEERWTLIEVYRKFQSMRSKLREMQHPDFSQNFQNNEIRMIVEINSDITHKARGNRMKIIYRKRGTCAEKINDNKKVPSNPIEGKFICGKPYKFQQVHKFFSGLLATPGVKFFVKQTKEPLLLQDVVNAFYKENPLDFYASKKGVTLNLRSFKSLKDLLRNDHSIQNIRKYEQAPLTPLTVLTPKVPRRRKGITKISIIKRCSNKIKVLQTKPCVQTEEQKYFKCPNCAKPFKESQKYHVAYCSMFVKPCRRCGQLTDVSHDHVCNPSASLIQLQNGIILTIQDHINHYFRNVRPNKLQSNLFVEAMDEQVQKVAVKQQNPLKMLMATQIKEEDENDEDIIDMRLGRLQSKPIQRQLPQNVVENQIVIKRKRKTWPERYQQKKNLFRQRFTEGITILRQGRFPSTMSNLMAHQNLKALERMIKQVEEMDQKNTCMICYGQLAKHVLAVRCYLVQLRITQMKPVFKPQLFKIVQRSEIIGFDELTLSANQYILQYCPICSALMHRGCWDDFAQSTMRSGREANCPQCRGFGTVSQPTKIILTGQESLQHMRSLPYGITQIFRELKI